MANPLQVFLSYSHNQKDRPLLDQLIRQISPLVQTGKISYWEDSQIPPGADWEQAIRENLEAADLILFLVSSDYLSSDYVLRIEVPIALERQRIGQCQIVPVLLRSCLYELTPYAGFEFLPKTARDQRLLPVDQWENEDEALATIVRRLRSLVDSTQGEPAPITPAEIRQTELEKELADRYGLATDAGKERLRAKVKELKISEAMGRLHLVNCDRQEVRDRFEEGFDQKKRLGALNHYYFLSACPTQLPPSLGERMVYELLGELLDESLNAVHCRFDPKNHDRVMLEKMPLGYSQEKSQDLFRQFCAKWFGWEPQQDFAAAISANLLPLARHKYAVLPFFIRKNEWKPFFTDYFDWMVDQLNQRPKGGPTLLVFIVVYQEKLHLERDEKSKEILAAIDALCQKHPAAGHFYPLEPVVENDLRDWFNDLGEQNNARLKPVLDTLVESLPPEELQQYRQSKQLNMDRVELVQELVFDLYNR